MMFGMGGGYNLQLNDFWKEETVKLERAFLTSLVMNQSRMKEGTKKMWTHKLSSSVYKYVRNIYKGSGKTFGEVAAQARRFESEMDAWNEEMNLREGLSG